MFGTSTSESDYVVSFTIPKRLEQTNSDEHQPPCEQYFHQESNSASSDRSLGLGQDFIIKKQVFLQSYASLKFKQQEWPDLGLEDVDRQYDRQSASKSC